MREAGIWAGVKDDDGRFAESRDAEPRCVDETSVRGWHGPGVK